MLADPVPGEGSLPDLHMVALLLYPHMAQRDRDREAEKERRLSGISSHKNTHPTRSELHRPDLTLVTSFTVIRPPLTKDFQG